MDLDDAVTLLREVIERRGDWRDPYIDVGKPEAEGLRRAIRVILDRLATYDPYVDTIPSLLAYARRDKD